MNTEVLGMLRQRKVLIAAGVGLFVLLIWFVAVFSPEGHKLASANAKAQEAQTQQTALMARLDRLKAYSKQSAELQALSDRLTAAVPTTTDVYDYITSISNTAAATHVAVTNITPSLAVSSGTVAVIPVTVSVSGTYDETLAFIKALYTLPRLTVINQVSVSGGGTGTSRSTGLTTELSVDILAQPSALAGQTPAAG